MIEDTKKWLLSPERNAPQATREYAAHRLDTVLDKFLKTMQTTATRLQEKAPETGCPAERQGSGQGESTGFRSATVEPFAGRTGAAESICTAYRREVKKSFSIIVRGDVY